MKTAKIINLATMEPHVIFDELNFSRLVREIGQRTPRSFIANDLPYDCHAHAQATVTRPPGTPQPREFDLTESEKERVKAATIYALSMFIGNVIDVIYEEKNK